MVEFLGLSDQFPSLAGEAFFRQFACGNVTNIALNYTLAIYTVNVANELDVDAAPATGFKWQILVSDVFPFLQFSKSCLRFLNLPEGADVPECFAKKGVSRIVQQTNQERVHVGYQARVRVEDQYPILCGFKQPTVLSLRSTKRIISVFAIQCWIVGQWVRH